MPAHRQSLQRGGKYLRPGYKLGLALFFAILPWIPYAVIRAMIPGVEKRVHSLFNVRQQQISRYHETTSLLRQLRDQERTLHDETSDLFADIRTKSLAEFDEYDEIERMEEALLSRINRIHKFVQKHDEIDLKEAYGRGKYKIGFELHLSDSSELSFVVETVRHQDMPHSLSMFLEMVDERIWEGLLMVRSGDLIVSPPSKAFDDSLVQRIKSKKLVFNEDSKGAKYSLCFQGKGPSFYIVMEDRPLNPDDPCFGTVVENAHLLHQLPEVVGITRMRLQ